MVKVVRIFVTFYNNIFHVFYYRFLNTPEYNEYFIEIMVANNRAWIKDFNRYLLRICHPSTDGNTARNPSKFYDWGCLMSHKTTCVWCSSRIRSMNHARVHVLTYTLIYLFRYVLFGRPVNCASHEYYTYTISHIAMYNTTRCALMKKV